VIHTELGEGQAVLLHMETHKYYSLNRTGRLVWEMLGKGETPEGISSRIADEYGISPEQALADVQRVLAQLTEAGLVSRK
jgi:hypothetical protein